MKRALLVSFGLIMLGSYAGCLPDEAMPTGAGGSQGTAGTGTPGSAGSSGTAGTGVAGTVGSGGNDSSGVSGSQGGDSSGTAGNGTAGSGTAGNGTAGSGTAGNGTAGNGTAGSGGTGTSRGGAGGTAGTGTAGSNPRGGAGGTSTAGTGGTGTGGTGTAGTGGTGTVTIGDLFPATGTLGSFDGHLVVMPCGEANASGTDCGGGGAYISQAGSTTATVVNCNAANQLDVNHVLNVGGEAGKTYTVTVHIYGIAEPKNYSTGVTREATGRPGNQDTGASPTTYASAAGGHSYPTSTYNTYEIRVCRTRACATADESSVYYLNADTSEGHWTYVMNYEKDIKVIGGGAIRVRNLDTNCREIKNCGTNGTAASGCATFANNRKLSLSAAMPVPNATNPAQNGGLLQPQLVTARDASSAGQWWLIDVVKIVSVQ